MNFSITTHDVDDPPIAEPLALAQPDTRVGDTRIVYVHAQPAGVRVNHDTALTYAAVFACVRVISETLASLGWHAYRRRPDGGKDRQSGVVDWLLDVQPNPEMTAFDFRQTMLAWALTWGNGYAEIERDVANRPVWLWPIAPDRVTVERDEFGDLWYKVWNPGTDYSYVPAKDMFHLRGLGFDGLVGYSVISLAARTIGLGIAMDESGASFFGNGSRPDGILKYAQKITPDVAVNTRKEWEKLHKGPKNQQRVAVLGGDASYQPISIPNNDAQWLEGRRFNRTEIASWFRVQPHKIGDLSDATYSNIEEQGREFVSDTLMPWAVRLEQESNIKLFGVASQGRLFTKINFNALLRGNSQQRAAFYTSLAPLGVFNADEIRQLEDMNPIGADSGGEKRLVQLNMTTLETVGEEPEPPPVPPQIPPPDEDTEEEEDGSQMRSLVKSSRFGVRQLARAVSKALTRETNALADGRKKYEQNPVGWTESFYGKHVNYIREELTPVAEDLAALWEVEAEPLASVVAGYAHEHAHESQGVLAAGGDVAAPGRALRAAESIIERFIHAAVFRKEE